MTTFLPSSAVFDSEALSKPMTGEFLMFLGPAIRANFKDDRFAADLSNADLAYLLNIPAQQVSLMRSAPSSVDVGDRRIYKKLTSEAADSHRNSDGLTCIRPHHAILMRLFLKYPKYASILPPVPDDYEVYDLIQPLMRPPGQPLNEAGVSKRRWFAQLFGRSLVTSYKMLPPKGKRQTRDNSRPIRQIQTLIMLRFAHEFRQLLEKYRRKHMTKAERADPLYHSEKRSWDILRERDNLTDWMDDRLFEAFETELYERFRRWWDDRYMGTLQEEAQSRYKTYQEAIVEGNWINDDPVDLSREAKFKVITGAQQQHLHQFRSMTGLSAAEALWLLGIGSKAYFMYRNRGAFRLDPAISILIRHYLKYPDDRALVVPPAPSGPEVLETIQRIDPSFRKSMLGPFFGAGTMTGYTMLKPGAPTPSFARRAMSLIGYHASISDDIYWHMREVIDEEARARGLSEHDLWVKGIWHKHLAPKERASAEESPEGELEIDDDLD